MKTVQMQNDCSGSVKTDGDALGVNVFLKSAREHSRLLIGATIAFAFLLGFGIGNGHKTENAMKGQAAWYQHVYTPKVAAKVANDVKKKDAENCPPVD